MAIGSYLSQKPVGRSRYIAIFFSSNSSRNTPIVRSLGPCMCVFRVILICPKLYLRIKCTVCGIVSYGTAIYQESIVHVIKTMSSTHKATTFIEWLTIRRLVSIRVKVPDVSTFSSSETTTIYNDIIQNRRQAMDVLEVKYMYVTWYICKIIL